MHCPSCSAAMEAVTFTTHIGQPVVIDVCWPCHLIWFDGFESTSLSAASVIELFKRIHAVRGEHRNIVKLSTNCPVCRTGLHATSDIGKGGRFNYSRCSAGHGRLIAFTQFLREKNFIRTLQPQEVAKLSLTVKQIRCSSCGGPVDLEADKACTHCGSAISVLDEAAVEKALVALQEKATRPVSPALLAGASADALIANERARRQYREAHPAWTDVPTTGGVVSDLVEVGVTALLAAWLS